MLLFLPSALSLGNSIFSHVPRYPKTRACLISVPASFSKAATESSAEELSSHHFLLSVSKASSGLLSPGIRIFDWAIIGRPPIGSGLGLSPSHRLFWSTHVAQLHCISLYLAIEGLPPNLVPVPPCSCPWSPGSSAVSSPSPVQSRPRHVDPLHQPRPSTSLHLNLHCTLEIPPPPRLLPPLLPTAAHPLSHFTTGFKTALLCLCCRVARPRLLLVPTCCTGLGNCKSHTHSRLQHGAPHHPQDFNQPGPNVRQPPAVRLTPAVLP